MGETFVFGKYRYCTYCKIFNYIIVHAVGWNEAGGWKEPGSLHQIRQNRHVVSQPARQLFPFAALIFSTFWHIDPAAHQDHCGRCRIQSSNPGPFLPQKSSALPMSHHISPMSHHNSILLRHEWEYYYCSVVFLYYRERESTRMILQSSK